jgi:hypothetical protein
MLASQRTSLITRGLALIHDFHASTITFPGQSPISASRRVSAASAIAGLGGLTGSNPESFLVLAADLPDGVTLQAKVTTFDCAGQTWLIDELTPQQAGEPHIRFTANLASR